MNFPESFRDESYQELDAANERKHGLPVGLLSSIRTEGERTNASLVSSAGARTPYQVIPATREAILKRHGIDAWLSPQTASESAAILLKESLTRNQGDPEKAVREYHGGTNTKAWGPVNHAYWGRVSEGLQSAGDKALNAEFGAFSAKGKADALSDGFASWRQNGSSLQGRIPTGATPQAPAATGAQAEDTESASFADKLIGAGEAALSMGTGALASAAVAGTGLMRGANDVIAGAFRGQNVMRDGVADGGAAFGEAVGNLTYSPRTAVGREYVQNLGEAGQSLLPIAPLAQAVTAGALAGGAARQAASGARSTAQAVAASPVVKQAAQTMEAVPAKIASVSAKLSGKSDLPPNAFDAEAAQFGSVGASGATASSARIAAAENLPVPVSYTEGQATRNFSSIQFEREMAKRGELGAPIRKHYAEQRAAASQNFDAMVDGTGALTQDAYGAGQSVDKAIRTQAAKDKVEIRVAYAEAKKAGEMLSPVNLDSLVAHLNESVPLEATAPILKGARQEAVRLGIASMDNQGQLFAIPSTLERSELFRQAVNKSTDHVSTNVYQASVMKRLVDDATANAGGELYQQARSKRIRYAQNYENHVVVRDMINFKRGTADRKIALEDVFQKSIINSSLDDVREVRRVLQRSGKDGEQAWRDLQGETIRWIRDQTTKSAVTDEAGNTMLSADKLNRAVKTLDKDRRLDFIFGKKGAETVRDLNEVIKAIETSPPGAVNTSNTASVMAAVLEGGAMATFTGLPIPIMSAVRAGAQRIKDQRIKSRIMVSLRKEKKKAS